MSGRRNVESANPGPALARRPSSAGPMKIPEEHGDDALDQALKDVLALEKDPTPEDAERLWKT